MTLDELGGGSTSSAPSGKKNPRARRTVVPSTRVKRPGQTVGLAAPRCPQVLAKQGKEHGGADGGNFLLNTVLCSPEYFMTWSMFRMSRFTSRGFLDGVGYS